MSNKQSHLEMIQNVINRQSNNSFLLKGWTVVLISAMFALATKESNILFIYLAYFPSIAFWCLDGYFLYQERLFRELFDYVRRLPEGDIDFSMDTNKVENKVKPWICVTFSKTLIAFHGVILASIIIVMLINAYI